MNHRRRNELILVFGVFLLAIGFLTKNSDKRPVGMTLLFLNFGPHPIGVARFDPDGQRGPIPGGLGVDRDERWGGKQLSFMPGDSQRPVPNWVDVEWTIEPRSKEHTEIYSRPDIYSAIWLKDHKEYQSRLKTIIHRVDLTTMLTPEIVARARKNPKTTNVKLKVIFKDDQVSITAENEVWR